MNTVNDYLDNILESLPGFLPEVVLSIGFLLLIIAEVFVKRPRLNAVLAFITVLVSAFLIYQQLSDPQILFANSIIVDRISVYFRLIFAGTGLLFILFAEQDTQLLQHRKGRGDLYPILIGALLGMNILSMASNLLLLFIGLEMVSLAGYILAGFSANNRNQSEAAIKYALFGGACSAAFLYGLSLIYGFAGSLQLNVTLIHQLTLLPLPLMVIIACLLVVGIGYKISLFPLHFWTPDVYEGTSTSIVAFLATASKAAGFALLIRLLVLLDISGYQVTAGLAIVAIASMIFGHLAAIGQKNVKRMLAFSSIGNTGFLFLPLLWFSASGLQAFFAFLVIYVVGTYAAFTLTAYFEQRYGSTAIQSYAGLGRKEAFPAVLWVIVLVSLIGLPPTAGFFAKLLSFNVVLSAYQLSKDTLLLITLAIAVLTTVISLYYYFKIPRELFLKSSDEYLASSQKFPLLLIIASILAALLLLFGIFPDFYSI